MTPRTDALIELLSKLQYSSPNNQCVDLCRTLERDLIAAQAALAEARGRVVELEARFMRGKVNRIDVNTLAELILKANKEFLEQDEVK